MPDDDEFAEFDFDEEEFEMKDDGRAGSKKQQQVTKLNLSSPMSVPWDLPRTWDLGMSLLVKFVFVI